MQTPNLSAVVLASDYTEAYGADTGSPERELWRAVLRQAGHDLFNPAERIRADAANFFEGPDLLRVLEFAGLGTSCAPLLREQARAICQQLGRSHRRRGVTYRGEVHSYREWSQITGLTVDTIVGRLRHGWSVERALTLPLQKVDRRSLR